MDFTDSIRTLALIVSFILLVVFDRKVWLNADLIATAGFGLAFAIFPRSMLVFQIDGELNTMHDHLTTLFGLSIASCAIFSYFTSETRDGTVSLSIMLSRIFMSSTLLLCQVYTQWGATQGKRDLTWDEQHVSFGMVGCGLWLLGHIVHLVRSDDYSTYPQYHIKINCCLNIDAFLIFALSLGVVAFPDYCIHYLFEVAKKDAVHTHMMRCIGAAGIGSAIISLQAPGYLHEHDKRSQFLARILTLLGMLAALLGLQLFYQEIVLRKLRGLVIVVLPLLLNAVYGYFFAGGTALNGSKSTVWPKKND